MCLWIFLFPGGEMNVVHKRLQWRGCKRTKHTLETITVKHCRVQIRVHLYASNELSRTFDSSPYRNARWTFNTSLYMWCVKGLPQWMMKKGWETIIERFVMELLLSLDQNYSYCAWKYELDRSSTYIYIYITTLPLFTSLFLLSQQKPQTSIGIHKPDR